MKPLFLILFTLFLVSCQREPLTLAQGQTIEQLNPGATVRPFRDSYPGPTAVARKADGSVWLIGFQNESSEDSLFEEELIPALQPKP